MASCVFCRIGAGELPAQVILDGDDTLFFHDTSPKARIHIVGIPKRHITSLHTIQPEDRVLIGKLLDEISDVAEQLGMADGGYRVITNSGPHAGQQVSHLHFHVLGGEPLGPLRC